ncbi:MAG: murein biosynthesis integral membrane protein MurJ [Actinobacteria bacterium]|nr:murein biosynthesis integral membrane protein MurJ [Actinomycetota bacterium]
MSDQRAAAEFTRATVIQVIGTAFSRVSGFGRVFALAYAIGFTRLADAYNIGNVTPNIVYELVLGGVLSATLVPVFVERLETDEDPWRAVSAVVTFALTVAIGVSALLLVAAPGIIRLYTVFNTSGSAAGENAVASQLLRFFAPQVFFYSAITVSTALLLARRRFANPKFSPIANNVVVIAVLMAFPHVVKNVSLEGVRANAGALALLGLGTTAGVAVQAFIQAPGFRKVRWVWDPRHPAVQAVRRLSFWTFGVVVANQVALYVALALANKRPGGVSVYLAAYMFFTLPHGVIAVSVMDSLLPELAARWTHGELAHFRQRIGRGLSTIAVLIVPAAAGYIVLARPIVRLTLEYGALHSTSAAQTAGTLAMFAIGLPGFSAYLLLMRGFQATQDTRSMFRLYVVENAINILLALVLHPRFGVQGLALSFALAYTVTAALAWRRLGVVTEGLPLADVADRLRRVLIATAVMTVAVLGVSLILRGESNVVQLARVVAGVTVGVTVYLLVARALRVEELTALLALRRRNR